MLYQIFFHGFFKLQDPWLTLLLFHSFVYFVWCCSRHFRRSRSAIVNRKANLSSNMRYCYWIFILRAIISELNSFWFCSRDKIKFYDDAYKFTESYCFDIAKSNYISPSSVLLKPNTLYHHYRQAHHTNFRSRLINFIFKSSDSFPSEKYSPRESFIKIPFIFALIHNNGTIHLRQSLYYNFTYIMEWSDVYTFIILFNLFRNMTRIEFFGIAKLG